MKIAEIQSSRGNDAASVRDTSNEAAKQALAEAWIVTELDYIFEIFRRSLCQNNATNSQQRQR